MKFDEKGSNVLVEKPKDFTKRFVPNWLIEVLAWIKRIEMASSRMSISSWTFKQLCWPKLHQNVELHRIPSLLFNRREPRDFRNSLRTHYGGGIIPIASIPPPNYIVGFYQFEIRFVDKRVVNFFKSISHLLQNCQLQLYTIYPLKYLERENIEEIVLLRALMECLAEKTFKLIYASPMNDFNQLFPGFLDHVKLIKHWGFHLNDENINFFLNWLTKSNNEKQKLLKFDYSGNLSTARFINRIKEEFLNSISTSIFLISFCTENGYPNVEEFTLENAKTNEILIYYRRPWIFYLARFPKGEEHWMEDGENKINQFQDSIININL